MKSLAQSDNFTVFIRISLVKLMIVSTTSIVRYPLLILVLSLRMMFITTHVFPLSVRLAEFCHNDALVHKLIECFVITFKNEQVENPPANKKRKVMAVDHIQQV